jgi:hypothetical protein
MTTSKKPRALTPAVRRIHAAGVPLDVAWAARDAAVAADFPLARLLAVGEAESGFRNVWGHDAGKWRENGPVTQQSVGRYYRAPAAQRPNGAGVWQLTYGPFQALAEQRGGLHTLAAQASVAVHVLKSLPGAGGSAESLARYNGTGPAARAYGARVHAREAHWSRVVSGR